MFGKLIAARNSGSKISFPKIFFDNFSAAKESEYIKPVIIQYNNFVSSKIEIKDLRKTTTLKFQ